MWWGRGRGAQRPGEASGPTEREDGDVGGPVRAQQGVLPSLVEGGLLVKHALHGPHHRLKAVHPKGERLVGLAVPVPLLSREKATLLSQNQWGSLQRSPQSGEIKTRRKWLFHWDY